jgi:hypothetical protein
MRQSKLTLFAVTILFVCTTHTQLESQSNNGAFYVGNGPGMYAHIADAESAIGAGKMGTVILSAGYTDVITSSLNIGWPAGPGVKVFMMPGSAIQENIMDGSAGIIILEGSALECMGASPSGSVNGGPSPCQVTVGSSSVRMSAMVTSGFATTGRVQDMFSLQGITFRPGWATVTAVGDFEAIVTPSLIANNNFFGGHNVTYEWHIGNGAGGGETMFLNNELRGDSAVTGAMVYITGGESGSPNETGNLGIVGGEVSCTGPNAPAFLIDGDAANQNAQGVVGVKIHGVWSQACPGSDSQPASWVSIHNASYIHLYDQNFSTPSPSYISISESAPGLTNFISLDDIAIDCVVPNCTGQTFITDTTVSGFKHPAPSWTNNIAHYGYQGFVPHDQAGGGWSKTSASSGGGVTVIQQTDQNLTVTQSGTVGSTSYPDAGSGYAWRVQNQGAINVDFGANDYANGWIESYQNGTTIGKPLNINTKYGGYINFGGFVYAPRYSLSNGDGVTSMPATSAVANHVACILSIGPPIRLGQCTRAVHSDGSCNCR